VKKIAQNVAQLFFCQNQCIIYTLGKSGPKLGALSKQSPIGRKFAQSGHAGSNQFTMVLLLVLLQVCPPESVMAF
jgi:hypothetical protein